MHITNIKIKNFRSYGSLDSKPAADLPLSTGVNYIAGTNNCGKSNLLRALALALDPSGYPYDADRDRPADRRADTQTTIFVELSAPAPKGPVKTLLKRVADYERSVGEIKGKTLAEQGVIRLHVRCGRGQRQDLLLASGLGARRGDPVLLRSALDQFRRVVRFVDIRSGEDLASLLERGFKEVLGSVVGEEHAAAMEHARKRRQEYIEALGATLAPIASHVQERIGRYVREMREVSLHPEVPEVEEAIARATFALKDSVLTGLDQKGTGVRGATLLMLLSFIAESSRRAVVFAIEEPESFLHPEAHTVLGDGLEELAHRPDVTVLVTTHSPFLFRSGLLEQERGTLFEVTKRDGCSVVGRAELAETRARLFGSQLHADLLARAEVMTDGADAVVVVEGSSDKRYIELAAAALGRDLSHIDVVAEKGALPAAFQAVILLGLVDASKPVIALFDSDQPGKDAVSVHGG